MIQNQKLKKKTTAIFCLFENFELHDFTCSLIQYQFSYSWEKALSTTLDLTSPVRNVQDKISRTVRIIQFSPQIGHRNSNKDCHYVVKE